MDFKIVFIDDNMSEKEPFVQNIRKHYKDADCNHVFQNPDKGLEFVLENLNSKMLVFIDWNFSGHHKKGIDLLKEIRKKTSLLYIVIMSAVLGMLKKNSALTALCFLISPAKTVYRLHLIF